MEIGSLYETLDEFEQQVSTAITTFVEQGGNLSALRSDFSDIGARAYTISGGLNQVIEALKFED